MTRIRRPHIFFIAIAALGLLLVAVLVGGSMPTACVTCHAMSPYALDTAMPHAAVACYRCHLENGAWDWLGFKTTEMFRMYPAALLGSDSVQGSGAVVSSVPCVDCHEDVLRGVTERNGLRINHETCDTPAGDCAACHSAAIHGASSRWARQPIMEDCVVCHRAEKASTECDTCHIGKAEEERLAKGSWQVTHGARWRETHGMGTLEYCSACHPEDYCADCHGIPIPHGADFGRLHGFLSTQPGVDCAQCHPSREFCDECHVHDMPHPADFLPKHSSVAVGTFDSTCLSCHSKDSCYVCHEKHTHPGATAGTLGKGGEAR